jgi:hypothetical protein
VCKLKVMGWPRSQMVGMLPFESPRCWTAGTYSISVEATTKGGIAYNLFDSLNDPLQWRQPIETSNKL